MTLSQETDPNSHSTQIRIASESDIPQICIIERSATRKFATIHELAQLAEQDRDPLIPDTVRQWIADGKVYVADERGNVVGFVGAEHKDNVIYIPEIGVLESHQGRGLGSKLLDAVFLWARSNKSPLNPHKPRVTLTTYADVPWNGPWYWKRGFREVEAASIGPWHVEKVREDERELARPGYRRCCMLWEPETKSDVPPYS